MPVAIPSQMPLPMMSGPTGNVGKFAEDMPALARKTSSTTESSSDGGSGSKTPTLDAAAAPFYPMGHDQVAAAYQIYWHHQKEQAEMARATTQPQSYSPPRPTHSKDAFPWEPEHRPRERKWTNGSEREQPDNATTERQRAMVAMTLKAAARVPAHHAPPVDLAELHRQILAGKEPTPGESTPRFPPNGATKSVFDSLKLEDDTPEGTHTPPQMSPMSALFLKPPPGLEAPKSLFNAPAPPMPRFGPRN